MWGGVSMGKHQVSRRRFLATASAGGAALTLAATTPAVEPAVGLAQAQGAGGVSPPLVEQLGPYANLPLPPEQAAIVSTLLAGPLAAVRGLRPTDYENLAPASIFRAPAEQ